MYHCVMYITCKCVMCTPATHWRNSELTSCSVSTSEKCEHVCYKIENKKSIRSQHNSYTVPRSHAIMSLDIFEYTEAELHERSLGRYFLLFKYVMYKTLYCAVMYYAHRASARSTLSRICWWIVCVGVLCYTVMLAYYLYMFVYVLPEAMAHNLMRHYSVKN